MRHLSPGSAGLRVVWVAALAALVVACGSGRPTLDVWEAEWETALHLVPPQRAFASGPDHELCERTVGQLRAEMRLSPAPNGDLEDAAGRWRAFAESLFFECPLAEGDHIGWESGYTELERLEAEVEALITFERGVDR